MRIYCDILSFNSYDDNDDNDDDDNDDDDDDDDDIDSDDDDNDDNDDDTTRHVSAGHPDFMHRQRAVEVFKQLDADSSGTVSTSRADTLYALSVAHQLVDPAVSIERFISRLQQVGRRVGAGGGGGIDEVEEQISLETFVGCALSADQYSYHPTQQCKCVSVIKTSSSSSSSSSYRHYILLLIIDQQLWSVSSDRTYASTQTLLLLIPPPLLLWTSIYSSTCKTTCIPATASSMTLCLHTPTSVDTKSRRRWLVGMLLVLETVIVEVVEVLFNMICIRLLLQIMSTIPAASMVRC